VEDEKLHTVRTRLLERFGGVTTVRQTNYLEGFWLAEEEVIPDQIVIYTSVQTFSFPKRKSLIKKKRRGNFSLDMRHPGMENELFMVEYKEELKREFRQQEVFITVSDLQII
jgi:hypothetical protein